MDIAMTLYVPSPGLAGCSFRYHDRVRLGGVAAEG